MSDEQPRKRMRKGTHSCVECRRRKKSCLPHLVSPGVCTECFSRGLHCREQVKSASPPSKDSKQDLQRRVAELESALLCITQKLETEPHADEAENGAAETLTLLRSDLLPPTPASLTSGSSPHEGFDGAPALSLFDNAILTRRPDSGESERESSYNSQHGTVEGRNGGVRMENIHQTLLSLFPTQQRLKVILDASHDWWASWQYMFPAIFGSRSNSTIHEFVTESRSSDSVQRISKALLCVAIGLQETSVVYDAHYDIASAHECTENFLHVIEDLVLSKDDLAGTVAGIECMILHAKHDSNNGRVRRAWVTIRRAISFAQLQGLHRQMKQHFNESTLRKQSLWRALYQSDRFMSLILGLPYSVSEMCFESTCTSGELCSCINLQPTGETFLFRLANIFGHIIDRNQEALSNQALTVTVKIEGELIDLATAMTSEWWALDDPPPADISSQLYSRYLPQFWHYQARVLLHLPFMLKVTTDRRYEYNKIAALESARAMLKLYQLIRPAAGFASLVCKVIDFQAFTAAMVLILNMLGLSQINPSLTTNMKDIDTDRSLVSIIREILQKVSFETSGLVATQAARALAIFSNDQSFQGAWKIAVPYFGTVSFEPGKSFAHKARADTRQDAQLLLPFPSPSEDPLNPSPQPQDQWSVFNSFASMPSDFNFGPPFTQRTQDLGTNGEEFTNVNFDMDQDWEWFWNNTEVS